MPENYNPCKDILLGPWCIFGNEEKYQNINEINFEPDPFSSFKEMKQSADMTSNFAEYYLKILADHLNKENNINYSIRSWRFFLMPWLLSLVQITFIKQKLINNVISKYKNENVFVNLLDENIQWDFIDSMDFLKNGIQDIHFNHWIFSRLLEKVAPDHWKFEYTKVNYKKINNNKSKETLKTKMKMEIDRFLPIFSVEGIGITDALLFETIIFIKSRTKNKINNSLQNNEKSEIKWNLNWESLVSKIHPKSLNNISDYKNMEPKRKNLLIISFSSLYHNDMKRGGLCLSLEKGSKLVATQHGGCYGTHLVHSRPAAIEYQSDSFISWGWEKTSYSGNNIIPASSPSLSKKVYKQNSNKLIFVNSSFELFQKRIDSSRQPNQQIHAREDIVNFFNHLEDEICVESVFRPFHYGSPSLDDKDYIKRKFPYINFITGDLHDELMKCKLLVLNAPNTTFNIAMSLNIPTISIWSSKHWEFDEIAKPYFDNLSKQGIIYSDAAPAANKINEIWNNLNDWWLQPQLQKARIDWSYQYSRRSKHWRKEWIKAIWDSK
jgi:putative transferase (TIGR04331 family)